MQSPANGLLTDLYQLNMIQAYLDVGKTDTAVFEFFVRKLPTTRNFLMAAGLEQALDFLEDLRFSEEQLGWLAGSGRFSTKLIDYLAAFRFDGEVHAMPEGSAFFGNEPILRVTASLPQAQLVETRLINILHFQSLIASKAARMVLASPGKSLVDFGLRRAHGAEAGLMAARASYIAGFTGTATLLAEQTFGIPTFGTMAHSFIEAFDDEVEAFRQFAIARPDNLVLLIDTYDTERAARKVAGLAPELRQRGIKIHGVRIDSGDLVQSAKSVRSILDTAGMQDTIIFVSGGLDEISLSEFAQQDAPIDGIGIGTSLTTSSDVPALDCAYKLQEYGGLARRKHSTGKATWPGRKQVWRQVASDGTMASDVLSTCDDEHPGTTLVRAVMREGRRIGASPALADVRAHARAELASLPLALRRVGPPAEPYQVLVAEKLHRLAASVDQRIASQETRYADH